MARFYDSPVGALFVRSVQLQPKELDDYREVVGESAIESLRAAAEPFRGKRILHINSTAYGGGVAEILASLVPLTRSLDIDAHWQVIDGNEEFFWITKTIHNGMHGGDVTLTPHMLEVYRETNRQNAEDLEDAWDIVVVHDPQPMPLIREVEGSGQWVWRCHVDPTNAVRACRELVSEYLPEFAAGIFSLEAYSGGVPSRMPVIIPPSIDPLAPKNEPMSSQDLGQIAARYEVDTSRPILSTVSRFDPWKDPLGVIDTFRQVRERVPGLQLLLIGSMAQDDPEGWSYYEKSLRKAGEDPDIFFLTNLRGVHSPEVNAFQRLSAVGLLQSIREGFGLSVAESLWKAVPVVATNTGGIPLQVLDGKTGFLVENAGLAADRVRVLMTDEALRQRMGVAGREHVQQNFLITRHLMDYLRLFARLEDEAGTS